MKLENIVKYFSPKSMVPGAVPCGMTSDTLTITDVMASLGLASAQAEVGIELYLAKAGVLPPDGITNYIEQLATERGQRHRALQKMPAHQRSTFLRTLAEYVFRDYSLSAASLVTCNCCSGTGFIDAEVFIMKSARMHDTWLEPVEKREQVKVICKPCDGKGQLKNECRCRGRGEVLDKKKAISRVCRCSRSAGAARGGDIRDSRIRKYIMPWVYRKRRGAVISNCSLIAWWSIAIWKRRQLRGCWSA